MKGLQQFIVELRNSKDQEEEYKKITQEINNIHQKFQSGTSLNGYQRKKYICKLLYIYIVGNSELIDFGLKESFELLNSSVFSEKKLGYLAVSILLNNHKNSKQSLFTVKDHLNYILDEAHEYLIRDLQSRDEEVNCLAIQMIANCFTASNVIIYDSDPNASNWIELIDLVYASVTSPMNKPIVKQKALLALNSLLQLYPEVILKNVNWIPRLLKVIEESKDFGVLISTVPLLNFLLSLKAEVVKSIIPSVSRRLYSIVVENECPQDYYYYDTPAPWLVVKLLRFVENCFLVVDGNNVPKITLEKLDQNSINELRQVVFKAFQNASKHVKGLPNRNSQSAILFQAVSLAVFLDASSEVIMRASNALLMLINSNETNTRYLALDALIKLTSRSNSTYLSTKEKFTETLPIYVKLLNDRDISVKRKALDLLYTICNSESYTIIVNELLNYFPHADMQMKQELAIKIAVLAEQFATDSIWYVTTMLKLLSTGGESSNGVGFIGSEVWERIVQIVVNNDTMQKQTCKIIINLMKRPFNNHQSTQLSENLVKVAAFILGEYGDQVNDIAETNIQVQYKLLYGAYFTVSLSTRAMLLTSFLKFLVKFPESEFVPEIVDLFEIETQSMDLEIQTRAFEYLKLSTNNSDFALAKAVIRSLPAFNQQESPLLSRLGIPTPPNLTRSKSLVMAQNIKRPEKSDMTLTSNWYSGYHRMLNFDAGIFFENQLIKITYRIVKSNFNLAIKFIILNNASKTVGETITGLTLLNLESLASDTEPNYTLHTKQLPESNVVDKTQLEIDVKIRGITELKENPILSLTFKCGGSFNHLNLKFPVSVLKTLTPTALVGYEEFERRWSQIGNHLKADGEYITTIHLNHRQDESQISRLLTRVGFAVVQPPVLSNAIDISGVGILHTQKSNYGLLVKFINLDEIGKDLRLVARCTGGGVAEIVALTLKEIFVG
ncbi:uncharacterized protein KGF55_003043 [Candida pseudojiufengensis]|uniref:uncharacterized protein n=1 Tax=Candida pseudojiufengensis TaxID=497109 RepID=UPI0022255E95|nr:uncharacterized protein KGF55_003043 [Candida pseudojiufengensis]KAI5963251.1 hypothetical protein KGF55_003043 [Candida pseudojiufengensis]